MCVKLGKGRKWLLKYRDNHLNLSKTLSQWVTRFKCRWLSSLAWPWFRWEKMFSLFILLDIWISCLLWGDQHEILEKKSLESDACWARTESSGLVGMRTNDYGQVVDVGLLSLIEVHYCVLISSSSRWKNVIALSGGSALEKAFPCYGCVAWWFCNVLRYVVWQVWKDWMVVKSHILFVEDSPLWKVVKKSFLCFFFISSPKLRSFATSSGRFMLAGKTLKEVCVNCCLMCSN